MRIITLTVVVFGLGVAAMPAPQALRPAAGAVLEKTTRLAPGRYRLASPSLDRPALVIRGENITIDLTGVEIDGADPAADPDTFTGTGVLVEGGGVTLKGGIIRGFKVGILARKSPRLHITGADVSFNWKPRLLSGIEQEDQSDWLSFHNNERDEWLRYGAAIYLSESDDSEIDHTRAVQGMNGLMVTRSARLRIWNNTFSWLSGVGLGLYRTTDSTIMHNRLDWDVRGYSHGFYNRGQDSAGLLMYEQSSRNVVAFNSITHGGDGVFLWAGQSTMDTGEGGANDNVFYDNDLSHAVANGIEATFSRNIIVRNRIDDSWHGIWGGYSFDTLIADNTFDGNTEGIALEHGQHNTITGNRFTHEDTAIRLWANTSQDPSWGYAKRRDTKSRDYTIARNAFASEKTAVDVLRTSGVRLVANDYRDVATALKQGEGVVGLENAAAEAAFAPPAFATPVPLRGAMDAKLPAGARRGRATIIVDDWGPYDYRSPKLWPAGSPGERPLHLRVLGPPGQWTLASIKGASASPARGAVPGEIVVTPSGTVADLAVDLEYRGAEVVTPRGEVIAAGRPSHVTYALFDPAIEWHVKFWKFDAATDPLALPTAFDTMLATSAPVRTATMGRLGFANAQAFGAGFTVHIGVMAEGSISLPEGAYRLSVTSDDGIRLWVDDRLVLEDWTIHGPKEDRVPLSGGAHRLRVQYFQNTGAAALIVKILR
jgi:parallel beta-helix repeat protein